MTNIVKTMLNSLYDAFHDKYPDNIKAWDKYLEFIVTYHSPYILMQLNHKFEWLLEDSELIDKIFDIYQPQLLKQDRYDYLGEIYKEKCVPEQYRDKFLIPYEVAQADSVMTVGKTDEEINILEPMARTGRRILSGFELATNATYFGVESDLRLARIALTNISIHNIKGYILNAIYNFHEIDIHKKMGLHNWKHSNKWYSQTDKLKPKLVDMPKQNKYP